MVVNITNQTIKNTNYYNKNMVLMISDEQSKCHHVWSSSNDWRCPKCFLHMQTYVQLQRIKEEVEKDPQFIKLKEDAQKNDSRNNR